MAESLLDLRAVAKVDAYAQLATHIDTVLHDINDPIAEMATVCSLVHHAFGFLWTGFYRVIEPTHNTGFPFLRVGPYQGTLGCLDIAFGRGVCGTVASMRETIIVHDVREFHGHIACDSRARSEIVVPVVNRAGALIAVLDIDADRVGVFDTDDRAGLETIVQRFARS